MWQRRSGLKYNNRKATVAGVVYDSSLEASYGYLLNDLVARGVITDLTRQVRYPFVINGQTLKHYAIPDFRFTRGGLTVFFEVKGFPTEVYRLKREIIEATLKDNERYLVAKGDFTGDEQRIIDLV